MTKPSPTSNHDKGITLVELMVAIVILSVAAIAVMRGFDQSSRELGNAKARLLAQTVALNRIEELKLLGAGQDSAPPETVEMGPYVFVVSTELSRTAGGLFEATVKARSQEGGVGALFVTYLSSEARNGR